MITTAGAGQTPLVDAAVEWRKCYNERSVFTGRADEMISAEFARTLELRVQSLEAQVKGLEGERDAHRKESDLRLHMILTCGVAADHPDANLSRTGAYIGKWNSQQAERVRTLRQRTDAAEAKFQHWSGTDVPALNLALTNARQTIDLLQSRIGAAEADRAAIREDALRDTNSDEVRAALIETPFISGMVNVMNLVLRRRLAQRTAGKEPR